MTARETPEPPQYPAGPFVPSQTHDAGSLQEWIGEIERAPLRLRDAVSGLTAEGGR